MASEERKEEKKLLLSLISASASISAKEALDIYEERVKNKPLPLYPTDQQQSTQSAASQKIESRKERRDINSQKESTHQDEKKNVKESRIVKMNARDVRRLDRALKKTMVIESRKKRMRERQKLKRKEIKNSSDPGQQQKNENKAAAVNDTEMKDVAISEMEHSNSPKSVRRERTAVKRKQKQEHRKAVANEQRKIFDKTGSWPKNRSASILKVNERQKYLTSLVKTDLLLYSEPQDLKDQQKNSTYRVMRPKPLSSADKKRSQIYALGPDACHFKIYVALHYLWQSYIADLLSLQPTDKLVFTQHDLQDRAQKLSAADLHGAFITVHRARCVSRVGMQGIVIRETRSSFTIVTKQDTLKMIPKEGTVFRVPVSRPRETAISDAEQNSAEKIQTQVGEDEALFTFLVYGSNLIYRAADRGGRKFKSKATLDI
ncbi:uncharacterized protein V2V93DRAFT_364942 [Kockiozyma suomiensis]|uniref:uncharacterized protein n=1 Tax=Kockiozyma suomiensis TaxID=1337062 RepID=UPI0033436A2F